MPTSPELIELVQLAQKGDKTAFAHLMEKTHGLARKTAFPVVRRHQVDDVVQEAFLLVFQKIHHLRKPEAFQAWLCRIVLHTAYSLNKKNLPAHEILGSDASTDTTAEVAANLDLRKALESLKPEVRDALILREFLGFSYEDTAFSLRLPVGTVRSRLHYGRKLLAKLLRA